MMGEEFQPSDVRELFHSSYLSTDYSGRREDWRLYGTGEVNWLIQEERGMTQN